MARRTYRTAKKGAVSTTDHSKIAVKGERAQRLQALKHQPGWADLEEIAAQLKDRYEKEILASAWRGEPLDSAAVAEKVAFSKALHFLLKQPDKAESSFELAARKEGTD